MLSAPFRIRGARRSQGQKGEEDHCKAKELWGPRKPLEKSYLNRPYVQCGGAGSLVALLHLRGPRDFFGFSLASPSILLVFAGSSWYLLGHLGLTSLWLFPGLLGTPPN